MRKLVAVFVLALVAGIVIAACGGKEEDTISSGGKLEHNTQQQIENNYGQSQPVPILTNSQVRENLIEIEEAIAEGVQTTSFFFNLGVATPIKSCPSIGVPIPATAELTNPEQIIKDNTGLNNGGGNVTLPQMDPDGIYKGSTEGTFVLCINAKGEAYVDYWEGNVDAEFAPAVWNKEKGEIEDTGAATWNFSAETASSGAAKAKK